VRSTRECRWGSQSAAAGGVGRPAGQHAESRAALVARADRRVDPSTWEDPALAQLWGPRYHTYVVASATSPCSRFGRLPDNAKSRLRAERMLSDCSAHLDGTRMTDGEVGRALGVGNSLRYAQRRARSPSAGRRACADRLDGRRCGGRPCRRASRARSTLQSAFSDATADGLNAGQGSPGGPRLTHSGPSICIAVAGSIATWRE